MIERATRNDRIAADLAIADLLKEGHPLTLFDLREIFKDFNMSSRPAAVDLVRRIKFRKFTLETGINAVVIRYLNMDVILCPDDLLDIESVASTRFQIEEQRALRSPKYRAARALQAS